MVEKIVLAGASGLIGEALTTELLAHSPHSGHSGSKYEVHKLVRKGEATLKQYDKSLIVHEWDPVAGDLDAEIIADAKAIISLNGASVGKLPWTKKYKQKLYDSRLAPTRTIAGAIEKLGGRAPKQWISASAVGVYGSKPGQTLTEDSAVGVTFLAKLCEAWEGAASKIELSETKVTLLRTAPVLHPQGVLKPMILLTKLGLAGPLAGGKQKWPWISLDDEVHAILHCLKHEVIGPVNLTAPNIVSANEIGRALAQKLKRPFLFPAPKFLLNMVLGKDTAESLLTADAAVLPEKLLATGFQFKHETPESCLESL